MVAAALALACLVGVGGAGRVQPSWTQLVAGTIGVDAVGVRRLPL